MVMVEMDIVVSGERDKRLDALMESVKAEFSAVFEEAFTKKELALLKDTSIAWVVVKGFDEKIKSDEDRELTAGFYYEEANRVEIVVQLRGNVSDRAIQHLIYHELLHIHKRFDDHKGRFYYYLERFPDSDKYVEEVDAFFDGLKVDYLNERRRKGMNCRES